MQGLSGYNQVNLGYLDSALENIQFYHKKNQQGSKTGSVVNLAKMS